MVERRQSPLRLESFTYQNNTIDKCNSYPYFGTIISNNGQFKLSINEISKNARITMYTLVGNVNKLCAGNVNILIDLYDRMILRICTYN